MGAPVPEALGEGVEEGEFVPVVPVVDRSAMGGVDGHDPQRLRCRDDAADEAGFAVKHLVAELSGHGDVGWRGGGGDGDAVVGVGSDVGEVVAEAGQHRVSLVADAAGLGLLEAQHVRASAGDESFDSRQPGSQRVQVPRRDP
jgi:hypothetical protein